MFNGVIKMRKMKNSGIEWVGDIPDSWDIHPLYCFFEERINKNIFGKEQNLLSLSYGKIKRKDINSSEGLLPANYNTYNIVHSGDIVIRPTDLQNDKRSLRTGLVEEQGIITSAYIALKPKKNTYSKYFHYLLHIYDVLKVFYNMGNGVRQGLNYDEFSKLLMIIPPIEEQRKIAEFLDEKCVEIDALIADIKTQIESLEQYKRSVITEAVTKGLNHSVEMKDSGIKWVGEMPLHWDIKPNKYLMKKVKDISVTYNGENILSLTMNGVIVRDLEAGGKMPTSFDGYQIIKTGNLLMCLFDIDVTPRCVGLIKNNGVTSPAYSQYKMRKGALASYYNYYYLMVDFTKELLHMAKNLRHSLNEEQFGAIKAPVPPIEEQKQIADYLDNKCAQIEELKTAKQSQIETLEAYKKSIIYEYVTGKKEVV